MSSYEERNHTHYVKKINRIIIKFLLKILKCVFIANTNTLCFRKNDCNTLANALGNQKDPGI
jgi:hypothetical protein